MVNKHNLEKLPPSLSPGEFSYPTHNSSAGKESACNVGDLGLIPGLERSSGGGEGKGYPLQYSGLENSMDCIVYGVTMDMTEWLSLTFSVFQFPCEFTFMILLLLLSNI